MWCRKSPNVTCSVCMYVRWLSEPEIIVGTNNEVEREDEN